MKSRLDKKMQISLFDDFENIAHNASAIYDARNG
jgi:hypothetical protein